MLRLYRRHLKACPHKSMAYRRCKCPVWAFGSVDGKRVRKALDTVSWETGEEILRGLDPGEPLRVRMTVSDACDAFIRDCEDRHLAAETIGKYKLLSRELKEEFKNMGVSSVTSADLDRYRHAWKVSGISARKKLERLKSFFSFCLDRGWSKGNPAKVLKAPQVKSLPTLPFSDDEIEKMLWAIDLFPKTGRHSKNHRDRIRAFVNLLRFSGLRIRDAVTLTRDKIMGGRLILETQKTRTPIFMPLPKSVIQDLEKIDEGNKYFFWTGNGSEKSGVSVWQRTLAKLFENAGIANGHAHRFRDTFSVKLLSAGVSLEAVSVLLGHSSVKITEKHYAPWVKSRQIALEESVEKAWQLK